MKKVLLTGATGFIGHNCIEFLLSKNYEVHAVFNKNNSQVSPKVYRHSCNLHDPTSVTELIKQTKPSHLMHLAWYATPGKFWTSPENLNWVKSSIHIIQEFVQFGGKRAVIAGSCAEYDWNSEICKEDSTPLNPSSFYGTCKALLYQIVQAYAKQVGLSLAWGRVFFLYGPREAPERLVPSVITSLMKNDPPRCSHGKQIRDFMHVKDVANAFAALLDSELQGSINIASGKPITLKEVIDHIAQRFDAKGRIQYGAIMTNDAPKIVADTTRLSAELNWSPNYDLEDGLNQTIDWWLRKA